MSLFVGVDGGGTKTSAVVIDVERRVIGECKTGASNQNSVGEDKAKAEVLGAITGALAAAKRALADVAAVALCMSGVDRPEDVAMVKRWMSTLFDANSKTKISVQNDACAALAAGTDGVMKGVALISGTGTICVGFDRDGQSLRASGWGPALGDEGSGHALGAHALRAVVNAADGLAPPTLLTPIVLDQLGLMVPDELIPWAYAPEAIGGGQWARIAALSRAVFAAASRGDATSLAILNDAGVHLSNAVACVCRRLYLREHASDQSSHVASVDADISQAVLANCKYDIVLSGGNLVGNDPALRRRVVALLSVRVPNCRVIVQDKEAAVGAALIARQHHLKN